MNSKLTTLLAAGAAALAFGGCASVDYPVTYSLPIGYSQSQTVYGVQNVNVSATHDSTVQPGVPMYYQITSPVPLTLYVFDKTGTGPGGLLISQMQGTNITSSATASSNTLEFVLSAAQAYTAGTAQLTISDRPLPVTSTPMAAAAPATTTTYTTVTPNNPAMPAPGTPGTTTTTTVVTPNPAPPVPVNNQTTGP